MIKNKPETELWIKNIIKMQKQVKQNTDNSQVTK